MRKIKEIEQLWRILLYRGEIMMIDLKIKERDTIIEPYEICPCGSDKKFKFCCYQKARNSKPKDYSNYTLSRRSHEINKHWDNTDFKCCFATDKENCSPIIKDAHAIQNNRILNRISEGGHLYSIRTNFNNGFPEAIFKQISRNKASTFFGFCDTHDTELFKPIEVTPYIGTKKQNFLLAFRAFALEYHMKMRALENFRNLFKENPSLLLQPEAVRSYKVAKTDVMDYDHNYNLLSGYIAEENFSSIRTFSKTLDFEINFAACSFFAVATDFEGNVLNDIHDLDIEIMPEIYLNIFPVEGESHIVLSYDRKYDYMYESYFEQLEKVDMNDLLSHLSYLVIEYTENIYFKPSWVDSFSEKKKKSILDSFRSSMMPFEKLKLMNNDNYYNFNLFRDDA